MRLLSAPLALALLAAVGCQSIHVQQQPDDTASAQQHETAYQPRYRDTWPEVRTYIATSWDTTYTEVDNLPKPFYSGAPQWRVIFYWDMYFVHEGLLTDDRYDGSRNALSHWRMAKNHADNLLSLADKYGFVPNASAPWGTNRSQPPYLSIMVRDVYERAEDNDRDVADEWLRDAYETLRTEYDFWISDEIEDNTTPLPGLQRYFHHATDEDADAQYERLLERLNLPADPDPEQKKRLSDHYFAEAESGMDFTPRFEQRAADFAAVDLNTNLYRYEKNFAWMTDELGLTDQPDWEAKAQARKERIGEYFWDDERGLFLDYDFANDRRSRVAAYTTFHPLWAGLATEEQAARVAENLSLFEREWGVAATASTPYEVDYQWGEDDGWAPVHLIVIAGLRNYGYHDKARRVAKKYLDLVAKNYENPLPASYEENDETHRRTPGHVYEKYEATTGTVNEDEYPASEFLSWTAATYAYAYAYVASGEG
ncbi:MAG: hypothetical protein BRD44_04745 [Bacteroidetes bacterium QS_7_67_15]|nr:MAG: hypothetical protein BRD44_04745 [Bacteroidetes bacterium QS_7_67_15]